jgi:GH25 family lysozyme M1 (1,4-beta-N-acetylmuramidase)
MVKFFDISGWQSYVDFDAMKKAGFEMVIIKASQGLTLQDRKYKEHFANARKAGLIVGAYHFQDADYPGVGQYNYFKSCINGTSPDFYVLDVEELGKIWPSSKINSSAYGFIKSCDKKVLLYSRASYILQYAPEMLKWIVSENIPMWYAYYGPKFLHESLSLKNLPSRPEEATPPFSIWFPKEWPVSLRNWKFHQWSGDRYTILEHDGSLDLNVYNGTLDELKQWAGLLNIPIPDPLPDPLPEEPFGMDFVSGYDMNVREGPGIQYRRTGSIIRGEILTALDFDGTDSWIKIGEKKWVAKKTGGREYLTKK